MNHVVLKGGIVSNATIKPYNQNINGQSIQKYVVTFSLAYSTRYYRDGEWKQTPTEYFDCTWFVGSDTYANRLTKGTQVAVVGKLKQEKWQNDNGDNRYAVKIHLTEMPAIIQTGKGGSNSYKAGESQPQSPAPAPQPPSPPQQNNLNGIPTHTDDDDIPF